MPSARARSRLGLSRLILVLLPAATLQLSRRAVIAALAPAAASSAAASEVPAVVRIYDEAAATYDDAYAGSAISRALDFDALRRGTLSRARGRVLELGVGTGLNLPFYPASSGLSLEGVDVSAAMLSRARSRAEALGLESRLRLADAAALPYAGESFDTVVDTFGLCVFERPEAVLREARRVLAPGGTLLLLEHDDSAVSRALSWTRGAASGARVAGSCAYDQQVLRMVQDAGYAVRETRQFAGGFLREVVAVKSR